MSDLRPGYRELAAPGALACLWVRVVGEERERTDVLPDGCSDLIWSAGRGAFVAGPDTGPVSVDSAPGAGASRYPGVRSCIPASRFPVRDCKI